jgi:hypothetical protein
MSYAIIDRQNIINLFHQLMEPNSPFRILRILGEAKLGKTHLITKVFLPLARQKYQAHCHVIDLRNQTQTILDVLHTLSSLLGGNEAFPVYYSAHREWMQRPKVKMHSIITALSWTIIKARDQASEERIMVRHLTSQFAIDICNLNQQALLLLFDTVEGADKDTQNWLMDTLLVQLASLDHVRIIVAGRYVPEPSASYVAICRSHELLPIEDEEAYITYCREVGATLPEQSIRDIAKVLDYKPGLFVDRVVPKYTNQLGTTYG